LHRVLPRRNMARCLVGGFVLAASCGAGTAYAWVYPEHRDIAGPCRRKARPAAPRRGSMRCGAKRGSRRRSACANRGADPAQAVTPSCIDWAALSGISGDQFVLEPGGLRQMIAVHCSRSRTVGGAAQDRPLAHRRAAAVDQVPAARTLDLRTSSGRVQSELPRAERITRCGTADSLAARRCGISRHARLQQRAFPARSPAHRYLVEGIRRLTYEAGIELQRGRRLCVVSLECHAEGDAPRARAAQS